MAQQVKIVAYNETGLIINFWNIKRRPLQNLLQTVAYISICTIHWLRTKKQNCSHQPAG